jgi:hypothetical protein
MHGPERYINAVFRGVADEHGIAVVMKAHDSPGPGGCQPVNKLPGMFFLDTGGAQVSEHDPAEIRLAPDEEELKKIFREMDVSWEKIIPVEETIPDMWGEKWNEHLQKEEHADTLGF